MSNQLLLERVKKCKQDLGISYKIMSNKCQIPYTTFYSFTGGIRKLPQKYKQELDNFLTQFGF